MAQPKVAHMRCIFLVLLLALPATAVAAEATPNASGVAASKAGCGASFDDALKQARASLAAKQADSEKAALACLIEAVSLLQPAVALRADGNRVFSVPLGNISVEEYKK